MDRAPRPHPTTPQPDSQRRGPVLNYSYPVRSIKPNGDNQEPQNQNRYYDAAGPSWETIETNGDIAALYRYLDNQNIDKKELAELAGIHEDSVIHLNTTDSISFKIPLIYKKIYKNWVRDPTDIEFIKRGLIALILKTARLKKQGRFGEIAEAMMLNNKVEVSMNVTMPIILAPTKNSAANIELSGDEKKKLKELIEKLEFLSSPNAQYPPIIKRIISEGLPVLYKILQHINLDDLIKGEDNAQN